MNAVSCLDEAAWSEFLADAARDGHEVELSQHLQSCHDCRQLLERMTALPRPAATPAAAADEQLGALKLRVLRLMETPHPADSDGDTLALEPKRTPRELPERIGRFQVLRRLGEGGFGLVLLAYDPLLRRQVALKLPRATLIADSQQELRFLREARAAGGLSHPQIVPVYEVGREGDQYFFSMGYVEGESLAARLDREGPLPPRQAARMIEQIAEALEYAHRHGIVHRDLKPQNVLLDSDGQPRVTDFGLAKQLSESDMLTVSGQVMGTPSFMSPEQAQGRLAEVGPRSDVYSLGAMLYHVLAGRPPFAGDNVMDVLKQVTEAEPLPLRKVDPHIPRDLETIALKCLDKSPRRRYQSAGELAAELHRCLNGEAILARPMTRLERAWRWVYRSPAVAGLSAAVVLALLAGGVTSTTAYFRGEALQEVIDAKDLDEALEDALIATLSGELDEAEAAITRAEALGAPAWRVMMLRGQLAYFRGEYREASLKLKQAAAEQPRNVAAVSMFAAACVAAGEWDEYEAALDAMNQLNPVTPEDHLFKGLAASYLDPNLGLSSLDEAVRLSHSPIARLIRAEVLCSKSRDTGSLQDAAEAVDDAHYALKLLPNHATARLGSLKANLTAAGIFAAAKDPLQQQAAEHQAAEDARALDKFRHLPQVAVDLAIYWQVTSQDIKALDLLREAAAAHPDDAVIAYNLALALYRNDKAREALELLKGPGNLIDNARWLKIWLLMEATARDDHASVLRVYEERKEAHARGLEALFRPCLLLLLGERDKALAESRAMDESTAVPKFRSRFYHQLLAYNRGDSTDGDLIEAAGTSLWDTCEAHFFTALRYLADDRERAKVHFRAALATRCYGVLAWDWSAVALARLEDDPTWPAWIK